MNYAFKLTSPEQFYETIKNFVLEFLKASFRLQNFYAYYQPFLLDAEIITAQMPQLQWKCKKNSLAKARIDSDRFVQCLISAWFCNFFCVCQ